MCGIIGIIGKAPVTPLLVDALKRLEYRGYDSAGVATLVNGHIDRRRAEGKLVNLEARLEIEPLPGTIGIGHTRWATHGKPSERNAHPIATDRVAIVHNGIIENFQELKVEMEVEGRRFDSDTDTEVVAQLITSYLEKQMSPEQAMAKAMERLRGAFALAVLFSGRHDLLIGARRGSSLVAPIKVGKGANVTAGSVVTEDIPADAVAFGRARQVTKKGRAAALREKLKDRATAKKLAAGKPNKK